MLTKLMSLILLMSAQLAMANSPLFSSIPKERIRVQITSPLKFDNDGMQYFAKGQEVTSLGIGQGIPTCLIIPMGLSSIEPGNYEIYKKSGPEISGEDENQFIFDVPTPNGKRKMEQVRVMCKSYGQGPCTELTVEEIETAFGNLKLQIND